MLRRLSRWLQPVILLCALFAIGWFLAEQWPALRAYPWRFHAGWFVAAAIFLLGAWALEIGIWLLLLRPLSAGGLGYIAAVRIWFLSAVVRYIPGNIWQPLSLTLYCRRHGVSPQATVTSLLLFQVILLLAVAPMAVAFFLWDQETSLAAQWLGEFLHATPAAWWWLLTLAPPLLIFVRPHWLLGGLNWGLARINREPLAAELSCRRLAWLTLLAVGDWILWGVAFAAFTFAVGGGGVPALAEIAPALVASYSIAYAAGFLSLITPSGFGVREGTFVLLLVPRMDAAVVTVIALAMRVFSTVGELILALASAPAERTFHGARAPLPKERPAEPHLRREPT